MEVPSKTRAKELRIVATAYGWDSMPMDQLTLLTWALFHYYVVRLGDTPVNALPT